MANKPKPKQASEDSGLSDEFYESLDAYAQSIRKQLRPARTGIARLLLGP